MSLSTVSNFGKQYKQQSTVNTNGIILFNSCYKMHHSGISFSMWNGFLKIAIFPYDEDHQRFNLRDTSVCIFLNQAKAYLFSNVLKRFKKDKKTYEGYGVMAGQSIITVRGLREDGYGIDITKINDIGKLKDYDVYQCKTDDYFYISNVTRSDGFVSYDKINDLPEVRNTDLNLIINQLDEFVKTSTNVYTYASAQALEFDIKAIKKNLGVD